MRARIRIPSARTFLKLGDSALSGPPSNTTKPSGNTKGAGSRLIPSLYLRGTHDETCHLRLVRKRLGKAAGTGLG
eukprot:COSAG01_NODE_538_length_15761_cov_8.160388_3_plen_75_part_00